MKKQSVKKPKIAIVIAVGKVKKAPKPKAPNKPTKKKLVSAFSQAAVKPRLGGY